MSEAELISLVNAKTPEDSLIERVRARGVNFKPSASLDEGLRKLKLTRLLAALTEPGAIEVTVSVPGAEVLVDGQKRATAGPDGLARVADIPPGEHDVDVRAEDYVDASQRLLVKPGATQRLALTLRAAVSVSEGLLGSRVSVQAGTPADAALAGLEFAEGAERIERLKKLVAEFASSPLALMGYDMLQQAYLEQEQYDNSLAAGAEVVQRDPKSFSARVRLAHAYLGKGEPENALKAADEARALLDAATLAVPPMGGDAEAWQREKQQALETARNEWNGLSYSAYVALSQVADPGAKRALLEHYLHIFPQSPYRGGALVALAVAAQQQGDAEAMMRYANEGLEASPDSPMLLMLVSDVLSERGQELARARELATRLLALLTDAPDKARPEGVSDDQWAAQSRVWQGLAHSILGQVELYEKNSAAALGEFRAAVPLLKDQPPLHARNLYRLGFTLASVGGRENLQEAQRLLAEVVQSQSPYAGPARDILAKVEAALRR
jgi:tetratricopeptide (TPR) repeat protein